jgi:hypothetical protein
MALSDSDDCGETQSFADRSAAAIRVVRRALANLKGLGPGARASQNRDVACAIDALESEDFGQACLCAECSLVPREDDTLRNQPPVVSTADLTKRLAVLASVMGVLTNRAYLKI